MVSRLSSCLPTGALLFMASIVPANGQSLDERLQIEIERLLTSYGEYKGYADTTPSGVEATLTAHRRAVFHAGVRAMFVEILQNDGTPTGHRVIDFADAVTGIWGVRPGDGDGKHQFRLSIRWDPNIADVFVSLDTSQSRHFVSTPFGHVLMPRMEGGDDEREFTDFDVRTNAVESFRHIPSRLQINYLREDASYGEIDIDFDPLGGTEALLSAVETIFPFLNLAQNNCHERPSNSDPLSVDPEDPVGHSHLKILNLRDLFEGDLTSSCLDLQNHCKEGGYENPPCGT